ncbi:MAG TPA: glycoside hydrolase family 9 protein, partial [Polyangiaceae bacterium]|nr:glycoside hydrolase family 9 protein [Polyangiaceae bacterium]
SKVGQSGPPYKEYWNQTIQVSTTPKLIRGGFVHRAADDPTVEFALHMGGNMLRGVTLPITVCIDEVYLSDPAYVPKAEETSSQASAVRVNQVGYFPGATKIAAVVDASTAPLAWRLTQGSQLVTEGKTEVFGPDAASGDNIHIVDFSSVHAPGQDYVLEVGAEKSPAFSIKRDLYSKLKYDALHYFYHNRSGIEIKMPYAGESQWARPAGHVSDRAVPCAADAGCNYKLDVSKGWYDAGDHGKYVVNGGIAVWTLMNQFERMKLKGTLAPFDDGKLNVPEAGNKVPDLLDEARWEMEFLLGMQVPEGEPHAFMVHHKMHDTAWTGLGLAPHEAERLMKRALRPVSTAATLNLVATAAQAARLFLPYDAVFAQRCLAAAERAYRAALKEPQLLADPDDSQGGGGPYSDQQLADDFYWAAAELWATTKREEYSRDVRKSRFFRNFPQKSGDLPSSMTWADTAALGTMSLSLVPGLMSPAAQKVLRNQLVAAADGYLKLISEQGYRVPFAPGKDGYPWGSNSFVINNAIVLSYAYDFTGEDKYLEGVIAALDYLLGRNALGQSYISGYGSRPLRHPHHRFWAQQVDARYPAAPPGALSGGPNSSLQDPYVQAAGLSGCAPQKCFYDHIEAWSVNEITINWNAPLAWVTAFLDEQGPAAKAK